MPSSFIDAKRAYFSTTNKLFYAVGKLKSMETPNFHFVPHLMISLTLGHRRRLIWSKGKFNWNSVLTPNHLCKKLLACKGKQKCPIFSTKQHAHRPVWQRVSLLTSERIKLTVYWRWRDHPVLYNNNINDNNINNINIINRRQPILRKVSQNAPAI